MVYTVTFNPAMDYIAWVDDLRSGETNRTKEEAIHPGGKGINVSIVLKRLGVESDAIGFIGGFTGAALEDMLRDTGIKTDFIRCEGNTRINVKLKEKSETEINGKGVIVTDEKINVLRDKLSRLADGDVLVLAGSIPAGMSQKLYAGLLSDLKDKDIKFVVDATGDLLKNTLAYKPFLIKPNVRELEEIFGVAIETDELIVHYARKLADMGAQNVIVSRGGSGAIMVSGKAGVLSALPPKGKVVDSVGAGDSLVAGFIAGYLSGEDEREAFRMGVATGSATAFSPWLAQKDLVDELIKQVVIQ